MAADGVAVDLAEGEAAEDSVDSGEVPQVGAAPAEAGSNNPHKGAFREQEP